MKKLRLIISVLLLVALIAAPATAAFSAPVDAPVHGIDDDLIRETADGARYVRLRYFAYSFDATVDWDPEIRAAVITRPDGLSRAIVVSDVGGFIEHGISWVPFGFADALLGWLDIEGRTERIDLDLWEAERFAEVRDASFSTDLPHGEIALNLTEYINDNLYARSAFTYRELETAVWIVEELLAMGHEWDDIQVQEFTYWDINDLELGFTPLAWGRVTSPFILGVNRDHLLRPDRVSQNVVLTLPGQSDYTIIVGAHYDSPPHPGASDNASGTALLLESAQRMLETDHYHTIVYVFFGAEEVGSVGAHYFYEQLTTAERNNILLMVDADALFDGAYLIYGAGATAVFDDEFIEELRNSIIEVVSDGIRANEELLISQFEELGLDLPGTPEDFINSIIETNIAEIESLSLYLLYMQAHSLGITGPVVTPIARQINEIAARLAEDIELTSITEYAIFPSDSLVFLFGGHTVVTLSGMERTEDIDEDFAEMLGYFAIILGDFTTTILHSELDDFHTIERLFPGRMIEALRTFSVFLEEILTTEF